MQDVLAVRLSITRRFRKLPDLICRTFQLTFKSFHTTALSSTSVVHTPGRSSLASLPRSCLSHFYDSEIIVDDLTATLQAHRNRNRAAAKYKAGESLGRNGKGSESIKLSSLQMEGEVRCESNRRIDDCSAFRDKKSTARSAASVGEMDIELGKHKELKAPQSIEMMDESNILEYEGVLQYPKNEWKLQGDEGHNIATPWLPYMHNEGESPSEKLCLEILAFEAYMKPTITENVASEALYADVKKTLGKQCSNKMLGSRSTGLATPRSDFNISASFKSDWDNDVEKWTADGDPIKRRDMKLLEYVERRLAKSRLFYTPRVIRARIPIICTKHIPTGLEVQVQGPLEYSIQQGFIATYLHEVPSLRPLYICLRHCLILRDMATSGKGGLGSYTLLIMIVRALKNLETNLPKCTLADQLLYVLNFWGYSDTYKNGYTVEPPGVFEKALRQGTNMLKSGEIVSKNDPQSLGVASVQTPYPQGPFLLCLQDPADYVNDLGKNTFAIKHIQTTFIIIRDQILRKMRMERSLKADLRGQTSMLAPLLQANYLPFEYQRSRIKQFVSHQVGKPSDLSERQVLEDQKMKANEYHTRSVRAEMRRTHWEREKLIQMFQTRKGQTSYRL